MTPAGGRRAVVTGGAGFIGSHVAEVLHGRGAEVLVVDDLSTGSEENVPADVELIELDICDGERLRRVVVDWRPQVVCHLAAQASVTVSVERPEHDLDVNVRGTFNVCEAAREAGAPVVFASTGGALYGEEAPIPTAEDFPPQPLSPYGASKLAGEAYVATWGRLHSLPNVVLRLGNVYGPRQNPHGEAGVVAIFSERLLRREPVTVYGSGGQTRDYVHVSDVADAFARATEAGTPGVFNVGTGRESSVLELLRLLQRSAGTAVEPQFEPLRPGELQRSALDATAAAASLGWHPRTTLADGLDSTFEWYSQLAAVRSPFPPDAP